MNTSKKTLNTVIASAFILTMATSVVAPNEANAAAKEKCYGVVQAGKNDCADADGKHSCVGEATVDASGREWVSTPKGLCDKLVGGSTTPKDTTPENNG